MKILATVGLSFLTLVACSSDRVSSSLPFFPQVAPQPPGSEELWLLAAYRGKLVVENGCVRLRPLEGTHSTTVLWYQGIELDRDKSGLLLRGGRSGKITRFNTLSEFGGGEAPAEYIERDYPEVARRCGPPYAFGYPANVYDAP